MRKHLKLVSGKLPVICDMSSIQLRTWLSIVARFLLNHQVTQGLELIKPAQHLMRVGFDGVHSQVIELF